MDSVQSAIAEAPGILGVHRQATEE